MKKFNQHKSGQAAIIIVVITMMTVLGVAISTSSQSRVELKDTVYSTQSVQALECAEAGVERALVMNELVEEASVDPTSTLTSNDGGGSTDYTIDGCAYSTEVSNYPSGGSLVMPSVKQNSVQEIRLNYDPADPLVPATDYDKYDEITPISFRPLEDVDDVGLAIYEYNDNEVVRTMLDCDTAEDGISFEDFDTATYNSTSNTCTSNYTFQLTDPVALRFRPLYSDMEITLENFQGYAGYLIKSDGTSGDVLRDIDVYRFYSQMPGAFDEAVVSFSESGSLE